MLAKRIKTIAALSLLVVMQCAHANPEGAQVVHGSASFSQPSANLLNVTNSHNAIINWQSFNIGQGQTTNFIQPSSASAVLNQVMSNNPSSIHGNLNSNGKVFVINQHGLLIGAGAQINTAGFFGSTLKITNEDFLNGNLKFEGGGFGGIQNYGYIHAGDGGNVVLVAPDIENGGVIEVDNGRVILAAGESITITSLNDAAIEFDLQSEGDSVINLGEIIAHQGAVGLFAGSLSHSGAINATGIVQNADGSISLVAQHDIEVAAGAVLNADGESGGSIRVQSHHGDVYFQGSASARGDTRHGGNIRILGDRVGLFGDALVDASGQSGGGEVLIGGDLQGGGEVQSATQTQVGEQASVHADAIASGDGGKIIVWSDDSTLFQGEATANGGEAGGDGGFIEISGKNLGYYGSVDASAPNGAAGNVLFDPIDVIVQIGGLDTLINPLLFAVPGLLFTFDPSEITDITNLGNNVTIQVDRDLTINDDIITNNGVGDGGDITFQAGQSIFINADIFTDNGTLSLTANDFGADFTNRGSGQANLTMAAGTTLDAGTGNLEISMEFGNGNGTGGDITLGNLVADHIVLRVKQSNSGGDILQHAGDNMTALSVFIDHQFTTEGTVGTSTNPLNMIVDNFSVHIHDTTTAANGNGIFIDAQGNSGTGVVVGETCYGTGTAPGCDTFGPHTIKGLETLLGGDLVLNVSGGGLTIVEPVDITDDLTITADGDITLDTEALAIPLVIRGGLVDLTSTTGDIIINGGSLAGVTATVESTSDNTTISANNLFLNSGGLDSDAIVIADNGTGALLLGGTVCANCVALAYDTRGDGATDVGVIAANFTIGVSWDGGGDAVNWTDPLNWSSDNLPLGNANVSISPAGTDTILIGIGTHDIFSLNMTGDDSLFISGGSLDIAGASTINTNLTINGVTAALNVDAPLAVNGALTLQQGTLGGPGDITVTGLASWNPPDTGSPAQNFMLMGGGSFFANGGFDLGINLNNDILTLGKFLIINNFSTWNDAGLGGNTIIGAGSIFNNDLIDAFNGAQLDINVPVTNNVVIAKEAGGGVLQFSNSLIMSNGSNLFVSAGTTVNPGTLLLGPAAELSGGGTLQGNVNSFGGVIDVDDGLGGSATLTITGSLLLDLNSTLAMDIGGNSQGVNYDFIDVGGNVTLDGTLALFWQNGFTAAATDTFDLVQTGGTFGGSAFDTIIDPAGVTDSSSSGVVNLPPENFRYVTDVVSNSIIFWNVNASGDWNVPGNWLGGVVPGASDYVVINQDDGGIIISITTPQTILGMEAQNNITITGVGALSMTDDLTFTGDSLVLDGSGFTMDGIATIAGLLDWNNGPISGTGSIDIYYVGELNINPGAGNLDNAIFNNTVVGSTWSGGASAGTGSITNNGLLDINGLGNFNSALTLNVSAFGNLTKSDVNVTTLTGTVVNGGSVQVNNGTLDLQASASHTGVFDIALGATLAFGGTQTSVGVIRGNGTVDTTAAVSFTNAGSIQPGGMATIGQLIFNGDLINTGFIEIDIETGGGAPQAGVDYDRLQITGDADLQGFMNLFAISGYVESDGDTFIPILYATLSNSSMFVPTTFGAATVSPSFNATDLNLVFNLGGSSTTFTGAIDNTWNNGANWDQGLPTLSENAIVPIGFNVTIAAAANANSLSLAAGSTITQSAGTLTLATDSTIFGIYNLNGGTLVNGGTLTLDGANGVLSLSGGQIQGGTIATSGGGSINMTANSSLNGAVLNGNLTVNNGQILTVFNGLTLNGTVTLASTGSGTFMSFNGSQLLTGTGSILMLDSAQDLNFVRGVNSNNTLTVDTGISISGSGFVGYNTANIFLINNGSISTGLGETITFNTFTNGAAGSLVNSGGTMDLNGVWNNLGSMTVDNAGAFDLGGVFNASAIAGGAYFNLDGVSTTTISGQMNLQGGIFTITDAVTGTGHLQMVPGGEMFDGTLQQLGNSTLLIDATTGNAQLDTILLDMDLTVGNGRVLTIQNGLTINPGRTITLASTGSNAFLSFSGTQLLTGSGSILLDDSIHGGNFVRGVNGNDTLTVDTGINISGGGFIGYNTANIFFVNNGTITANAGNLITFNTYTNGAAGSMVNNGGTMAMNGVWDNLGSMTVNLNGVFDLGGTFNSSALDSGKYVNIDGTSTTLLTTGTMNIQSGIFTLTNAVTGTGDITLQGGTVTNGTVASSGASTFLFSTGFNTFDSVILDMDLTITDNRTLRLSNLFTINAGRTLTLASTGLNTNLQHVGSVSLGGSGSILLDDSVSNNNLIIGSTGTLSIGAGINISGGGTVGTNNAGTRILNNGTITANTGDAILLRYFDNGPTGSLLINGGSMTTQFDWSNVGGPGSIDVNTGGSFTLGGNFNSSAIASGRYLNSDGTGSTTLSGTMDVQGGAFDLTDAIGDILMQGGTIINGTLTLSGAAVYNIGTGFNTLDNVSLGMDFSIGDGETLRITNGLTIQNGFTVTLASLGSNTTLQHIGTMTIGGSGSILLDDSTSGNNFVAGSGAGTLTIGASITISGGGTVGTNSAGIPLINNGTITANAGNSIDLRNFTNFGTISAVGGGILTYGVMSNDNDGIIDIGAGSSLSTGNASLNNNPGGVIRGSGTVNVGTATLFNDGTLQPGGAGATGILTVLGTVTMGSTADLDIEINNTGLVAGTDYDQLVIADGGAPIEDLNLNGNGSLSLSLLAGAPVAGSYRFVDVISGGSVVGVFGLESLVVEIAAPVYGANFIESGTVAIPVFWDDGGVAGDWFDPLNWSGDAVPLITDDVTINGIDLVITIAGAANANTLSLAGTHTLAISSGDLTLASSSVLNGVLNLSGGTLDATGAMVTLNSGFNWSVASTINALGITIGAGGNMNVSGAGNHMLNGTLTNNAMVTLGSGSTLTPTTLINNGQLVLVNAVLDLGGNTLQLDPGTGLEGVGSVNADLINQGGVIRPGGSGAVGTLTITGDFTNNLGTLEIEIDSALTHDVLAVDNALGYGNVASSILDISLISFVPSVAESHDVITCATSCAAAAANPFLTVNEPSGVTHSVSYNANDLNLTVTSVGFFWDGGGALDNWFDPLNWSLDLLPDMGTDVVFGAGDNVTFDGGVATVASLSLGLGSSLNIATGTLNILDNVTDLAVSGGATLTLAGGTLNNAGDANFDGNFVHSSGIATFGGNSVFNAAYTQSSGIETFTGTATFNGSVAHSGGSATFNGLTNIPGAFNHFGGTINFNAVATMHNLNNTWIGGTIAGSSTLVLGVAPGDTTLAISGGSDKTLDTIALDMNRNDINMFGAGNLVLVNGATIDNTLGLSFNHGGNGSILGAGTFINNGGAYNKLSGTSSIAVDFINNGASLVNIAAGSLLMQDAEANDLGTYNVSAAGTLVFGADRNLTNGALNNNGNVGVASGVTLTLPNTLVHNGAITLGTGSTLDLSGLGGVLQLNNGAILAGSGNVQGDVDNFSGLLIAGGIGNIGDLTITGNYAQGASAAMVIKIFNNGVGTPLSDMLTVGGNATLDGSLVIGFVSNSLGLVTASFQPFTFGSVVGNFSQVIDASGRILSLSVNGTTFTIVGVIPVTPQSIVESLIKAEKEKEKQQKAAKDNKSEQEETIEAIQEEEEGEEGSLLVCK